MRSNDELFREIANKYVEYYGETLHDELALLESNAAKAPSTGNLERLVRRRISAEKRRPYVRVGAALAACLVVVLLLPFVRRLGVFTPPTSNDTAPAHSSAPLSPSDAAPAPSGFAVIPLSASLPNGFSQSGFEQDMEKSIYYIEDVYLDNVVLTLAEARALPDTGGLVAISLGDSTAYGTQTDSYSLLTFCRDDVVYEMTCRYDINTLIKLGEALL